MSAGRSGPTGPAPALVESAAHAFVEDVEAPALSEDDARHLLRVLRLRDGDTVSVSDGAGRWRVALLRHGAHDSTNGAGLEPASPVVVERRTTPELTVAFAVPKGDRPELVVQKLTEIGADEIIPMVTARSIVRWDAARAAKHHDRFVRIVREAAAQSRRVWLPSVSPITPFATVAARPGAALAVPSGAWPDVDQPVVLVGPEGGWAPEELASARHVVGLGPNVLRVETAAIVACTLLVAARARSVNR